MTNGTKTNSLDFVNRLQSNKFSASDKYLLVLFKTIYWYDFKKFFKKSRFGQFQLKFKNHLTYKNKCVII